MVMRAGPADSQPAVHLSTWAAARSDRALGLGTSMTEKDDGPYGVGGWLAFLIAGMVILGPLSVIGSISREIDTSERAYPGLAQVALWASFKTAYWVASLLYCALSLYGGLVLATKRTPDAVFKAKLILWINAPVYVIVAEMILPVTILPYGDAAISYDVLRLLVASLMSAAIWTAYLSMSKRVKNTYGLADKPAVAQAAAEKDKLSRTKPVKKISRWVIFAVGCALALVVYTVWREIDRSYGLGFVSAALRGGLIILCLSILWNWARSKDYRPEGKSANNLASTDQATKDGGEYAATPTSNRRPIGVVQAADYSAAIDEERFYRQIAEEFETGTTDKGMWTRLFAECDGNEKGTEVRYIQERAGRLIRAARLGVEEAALNQSSAEALDEDAVYRQIAEEFQTGTTDSGLWTRLFAQCGGDERKTEVLYIRERAERLILAEIERLEQPHPPLTDEQEMEEHDITFDGERYAYGEYRYDKLSDAVRYAKLQAGRSIG
ncbi:MAG: hypothetical protein AW07_00431 [Candidatus Accumulibacter sp. SK-11]|nr:MAG: hypothetical protein AW07_00431 [Candidatus Accumulibacter sp. SK-11]